MKLSKLYSNNGALFTPIEFQEGLNVILAEIRLPENVDKDTHNLGKSTLARLLDFCFLSGRNPNLFLFRHYDRFEKFIFYLEIELADGTYLTIRRAVESPSKISFKKHTLKHQNYSQLANADWDHFELAFEKSKELLDGILDCTALNPWTYRKGIGYQLRSQDDYRDVFQLQKFASKHADWKPFLAHLLGLDAALIQNHYSLEAEIEEKKRIAATISSEVAKPIHDLSKIQGLILLKTEEANEKENFLNAFDFRKQDKDKTRELVNGINNKIATLNSQKYRISQNKKKIEDALREGCLLFNTEDAQRIFNEAGILFEGQIKKDFDQLIEFNRSITAERKQYLGEELEEINAELRSINTNLNKLGKDRSNLLSFLKDADILNKYKTVSSELVSIKAEIVFLEHQRDLIRKLADLNRDIREMGKELTQRQTEIEQAVEKINSDSGSIYSKIRVYFSEIVDSVISQKALLSISTNQAGHLEFTAEILDTSGKSTSADDGYTYRKLLCIAFDLAVLRAYSKKKFPKFVYHDGVFESLDDRKKCKLLDTIREYTGYGIQIVITLLDSDTPEYSDGSPAFKPEEIIRILHDDGDEGLLFHMPSW